MGIISIIINALFSILFWNRAMERYNENKTVSGFFYLSLSSMFGAFLLMDLLQ